jgi:flavorubredoxin
MIKPVCSETVHVQAVLPHYRFYYDCLMKPNARSVTTALRKVKDLPYDTICNGHGPMLRYNMEELVNDYQTWSSNISKAATSIAVLYTDNYGYCDRLSQQLARGIVKAEVATDMVDLVRLCWDRVCCRWPLQSLPRVYNGNAGQGGSLAACRHVAE